MTTPTVEEVLEALREDFEGGDMHDWKYGKERMRPLFTSYGTARFEEGEKAERERVRAFIDSNVVIGRWEEDSGSDYGFISVPKVLEFLSDNK